MLKILNLVLTFVLKNHRHVAIILQISYFIMTFFCHDENLLTVHAVFSNGCAFMFLGGGGEKFRYSSYLIIFTCFVLAGERDKCLLSLCVSSHAVYVFYSMKLGLPWT